MVILCGGLGTRLRAAVSDRPKPMALVEGRPFLEHLLEYHRAQGVQQFVLCAGYMGEQIRDHFADWAGVHTRIELRPLGTAGSVAAAASELGAPWFFVANGDSFCDVDLAALWVASLERRALGSLTVVSVRNTGEYGTLRFDLEHRLTGFQEKPSPSEDQCWVNAGVYVFSRELAESLPLDGGSLEREVFPQLTASGRLYVQPGRSGLLDIGTPERLAGAEAALKRLNRMRDHDLEVHRAAG